MVLGTDFAGGDDLHPAMIEHSGNRALADCIVRRLRTDTGSVLDHPEYGYNLADLIGTSEVDPEQVRENVLEQCFQEEEVEDAECEVILDGLVLRLNLKVVSGDGPFTLTISVDQLVVINIIPEV